jgi:hypothetical protein
MKLTSATTGPGSQMGTKSRAVLECLRKNGKLNRLDLEMKLGMSQLGPVTNRLYGIGYIKTPQGITGMYEITQAGRIALGEAVEMKPYGNDRICGGSMRELYIPGVHSVARVGIARV